VTRAGAVAVGLAALLAVSGPASAAISPNPGEIGAIAFTSNRCEQGGHPAGPVPGPTQPAGCNHGIFRVDADGSHLKRLTGTEPDIQDTHPTWSPDGTRIAFVRLRKNWSYTRLMVMNSDGSGQRELIRDPPAELNPLTPSWSPRGDQIATDGFQGIYTVDVPTGQLHRLTVPGMLVGAPVVSPDGARFAFMGMHQKYLNGDVRDADFGIWLVNLDGSGLRRLTLGGIRISSSGFALSPDWRYMALMPFEDRNDGDVSLWTVKLDGTDLVRRSDVARALGPTFSPFGPTLFFSGTEGDSNSERVSIRRVDLSRDGPSERVTDGTAGDSEPAWNPLGVELPEIRTDGRAPAVVLGEDIGVPAGAAATPGRAKAGAKPDRLPFIAIDRSGVRRVAVALARRKGGRCRFLTGSKLGPRKRCGKPVYFRFRGNRKWRVKLAGLPAGKYVVRFRTTDGKGNRTKDPKPRTVRLK
jgi:Tol biopolymer transport system component